MSASGQKLVHLSRLYALLIIFAVASLGLIARAVNLQVTDTEFLQDQGNARFLKRH